jgi:hypothetical protein
MLEEEEEEAAAAAKEEEEEEEEEGEEELEEEDLDEYEGVVQALSNLESTTRGRAFQSSLNPKHLQSRRFQAESQKNTTRALSDVDAAAGLFVSSASSSSSSWEEEEEEESSTTPATRRRHSRKVLDTIRNRDKQQQKLLEKNRRSSSCSAYATAAVAAAEQEEQEQGDHLRQRIEDLEKKVNMLITEEYYFHRISVPRGCFAVVLPGPSYAHRLTEDVIESLQMRIESIWPLCYLAPVVAQLVGFASAMFRRWLPLLPCSSPVVYNTCCCSNFTSSAVASEDLVVHHHHAAVADCHQTSTSTAAYVTKRLGMI